MGGGWGCAAGRGRDDMSYGGGGVGVGFRLEGGCDGVAGALLVIVNRLSVM